MDVFAFPWIEPPPHEHIASALQRLSCLSAVRPLHDIASRAAASGAASLQEVTPLGRVLSQLPVDVGVGKTLVLAAVLGVADFALVLAAGLSVQTPFKYQAQGAQAPSDLSASAAGRFLSNEGDPFSLLNVFQAWMGQKRRDPRRGSKSWCHQFGLVEQRLYEMARLVKQFKDTLQDAGLLGISYDLGHGGSDDEDEDELLARERYGEGSEGRSDRAGGKKRSREEEARGKANTERQAIKRQLRKLKQGASMDDKRRTLSLNDTFEAFTEADTAEAEEETRKKGDKKRDDDDVMQDMHALDFRECPRCSCPVPFHT